MRDPAFLFYPGDYLRDTQCLSEQAQVAYDRIMCEHMRNICISQQQLNFFTKRLEEDDKEQILSILKEVDGGYQIAWVADSIEKRREYSESRRNNRKGKEKNTTSKTKNTSLSYDSHMENEIVNESKDVIVIEKGVQGEKHLPEEMLEKVPAKVDEFEQRALQDFRLWESMKVNNKKLKSDNDCKRCISGFAARQRQGTDYYPAYQKFTWHLMNSTFYTTFDPTSKSLTKFGQALDRDITKELQFDEQGNLIITSL